MKFKWFKSFLKGLRGSALTGGTAAITLSNIPTESISVLTDATADSLAVAIASGDGHRVRVIILSALIGFVFEMARNMYKNREKFLSQ